VVDGTMTEVDGMLTVVDGRLSWADGRKLVVDGTLPVVDGTLPVVDEILPVVDGTLPVVVGTSPVTPVGAFKIAAGFAAPLGPRLPNEAPGVVVGAPVAVLGNALVDGDTVPVVGGMLTSGELGVVVLGSGGTTPDCGNATGGMFDDGSPPAEGPAEVVEGADGNPPIVCAHTGAADANNNAAPAPLRIRFMRILRRPVIAASVPDQPSPAASYTSPQRMPRSDTRQDPAPARASTRSRITAPA
jgi:hypothetical protein